VLSELVSNRPPKILVLVLVCLASATAVPAQTPPLVTGQIPAAVQPAAPSDPLGRGRETPRGTVLGFIRAAQAEDYEAAVAYFQTRRHSTPEQEQELAKQLLDVLNARFGTSALDSISEDPQGRGNGGPPRDQLMVGGTVGLSESFPLSLVRDEDAHGNKLWFISRQTLAQVPEIYDSLHFANFEKWLPKLLVANRPLGMPLWQWIAIILFAPIALALGRLVDHLALVCWQWIRHKRGLPPLPREPLRRFGPGTLLVATLIHYRFVSSPWIGTSLLYRKYYEQVIFVFLAFACYWAVTQVTHRVSRDISDRLASRGRFAERSLVSLTRRILDVLMFIIIGIYVLKSGFDVNVTAALAGLGIGGLAIGLGAQKTFENLLGGISILTDKAIVLGDPCKIGDQAGVVEDIGLRSTKLRTENRTLVSIPNGTVATATLENFRFRDKILCKQVIRLRYDLSSDHVRYVLAEVYEVLVHHAKVEEATARVRLLRFAEYAIEVELYAYILERDFGEFLAAQEDVLLQVMGTLERTGAAVALPSQTTMVTQDKWVDPEKAAAAERAIEKSRDPGVPGPKPPDLAPDGGKPRPPSPH
jgi:MscS family membrane protein